MALHRLTGTRHHFEHMEWSDHIEVDGAILYLYESSIGNLTVTDGTVFLLNSTVGTLDVVEGTVIFTNLICGAFTMAAAVGNSIIGTGMRAAGGLAVAGGAGSQKVVIAGLDIETGRLQIDDTFLQLDISGLMIGRTDQSTVYTDGGGLVDIDGVTSGGKISGQVMRAYRKGIRILDSVGMELDVAVIDPGANTDNTYDGISVEGTSSRITLKGSVKGAVNQASNPRYGVHVDATVTDLQIDMDITGAQTGEINNLAGLEVSRSVRISTEDPADGDVLLWDDANSIFRPDDGSGIGGDPATLVSQVAAFSYGGTLVAGAGPHRFMFPIAATIIAVRATVGTAPTGAAILVDVHKNGTTIFTTQANRPEIAVSTNASAEETPDVTTIADGDYITVDIDQIGSTIAGSDLTVMVEWRAA